MPGNYWTFQHVDERSVAGLTVVDRMDAGDIPRWNVYFSVDDCDAMVDVVTANGGTVDVAPVDIPVGRYARCIDPQGASFAVISVDPLAGLVPPAAAQGSSVRTT